MIKRFLVMLPLLSLLFMAIPNTSYASDLLTNGARGSTSDYCTGSAGASSSAVCTDESNPNTSPIYGKNGLLIKIANIIAFIAGIAAVIVIIVGALQYVTAGGDSNKASSARGTITGALIGLAIIVLAGTIIDFLINRLLPS
jgi:hypothetical protein